MVEAALYLLLNGLFEARHSIEVNQQCLPRFVLGKRICAFGYKQLAHLIVSVCGCFEEQGMSCDSISCLHEFWSDGDFSDEFELVVAHGLEERALSKPILVVEMFLPAEAVEAVDHSPGAEVVNDRPIVDVLVIDVGSEAEEVLEDGQCA